MKIANYELGKDHPCFIIAEVALAHEGSLGMAHAFIDAAAKAGADAVKFQTHLAAAESTPEEPFRVRFTTQDDTRFDYWKRMEFTHSQWRELADHAQGQDLIFLSSPFSSEAVELLEKVGVPAWKIASGEITNLTMLEEIARTGKPALLSTGMSPWEEIDRAVEIFQSQAVPLALFQCTSSYPSPAEKIGLNVLDQLRRRYHCPVGLSDHSGTIYPGLAAVTLGADLLEVHLTLSDYMFGPDVSASLTPEKLKSLVKGVRFIEQVQQQPVDKDALAVELQPLRQIFMKSLFAARRLEPGHELVRHDLLVRKPVIGIPANRLDQVLGRKLQRAVRKGQPLMDEDLCE